jgi:hypothetical protein
MTFLNAIPERRNAVVLLAVCGTSVFVPTLCFVLEDQRRIICFIMLANVAVGVCLDASLALESGVSRWPPIY